MSNPNADYPTAIHTATDTSGYGSTALGKSAVKHTDVEGKQEQELAAVQTKVGIGVSTPTAGKVLTGTGNGESAWQDPDESNINDHKADLDNPHQVTKAQVGLENVLNVAQEPANVNIQGHIATTGNPHGTTKTDIGLGSVDNTADTAKPVSTLQAEAIEDIHNKFVAKKSTYGLITDLGTLIEDFETIGDFTQGGAGGSIAADTTHVKNGTQGLKLTSVNNVTCTATKTISQNFSDVNVFGIWIYVDDATKIYSSPSFIYLSSTTDFSKYFNYYIANGQWKTGWNFIAFNKEDFYNTGSESWDNTMIRMRVSCKSIVGGTLNFTFDSLVKNFVSRPKVIISFDDGEQSLYTTAYPYMKSLGLRGVGFIPMSPTRVGQANYCTLAQLAEMYADGWDIAGHSYTHVDLTSISLIQAENEVVKEFNALIANGFTRSAYYQAWPFSAYNQNLIDLMNQLGMKASRSGNDAIQPHIISDFQVLNRYEITTSRTLTDYETILNQAINRKSLVFFNLHRIKTPTSTSTDITPTDFYALMDLIAAKVNEGLIDNVTFSEYDDLVRGLTTGDLFETPNKRFVTDAQLAVLAATSGANTGDETAITKGAFINGLTEKTTPADADMVSLMDSADTNLLKKLSWANIKATLKTYFDGLYLGISATAAAATKLITARAINGINFDGTADIKVSYITPADHNALAWTYDPCLGLNTQILAAKGTAYVARIMIPKAMTISNVIMYVSGSGGATLSNAFFAIYQNGSLLRQSSDQSTNWQSSGTKVMAITPTDVAAGYVEIVFWVGDWATAPTFARAAGSSLVNFGLSAANARFATADTGLTTTAPPTLGTKTALSISWWIAVS